FTLHFKLKFMPNFERIPLQIIYEQAETDWFVPLVNPELYVPLRPMRKSEIWSGSEGEIYAARVPEWAEVPKCNYAASRALVSELLQKLGVVRKVLIKPDSDVSAGEFLTDPKLKFIARENGISVHADLQPLSTQPAILAGAVDALLEHGTEEIHVAMDSPWLDPLRVAWELGYVRVFSDKKYDGKVFFINLYSNSTELEDLPIKWAEGYELGFFAHATPPKPLFSENYDLVLLLSIAKTHSTTVYSLLMKNFGWLWVPRRYRWHINGVPLKLFDREFAEQYLGYEIPVERTFETIRAGRKIILSNGYSFSAPLDVCVEGGEELVASEPHIYVSNLIPFLLSMGYSIIRYIGMFATILDELDRAGTRIAGLISGVVGMEGEGPLIYGRRRFGGFMFAGTNPLALEALALDAMFGRAGKGFDHALVWLNDQFCNKYLIEDDLREDVIMDAMDPWTLRLAEELLREERDPSRYTVTLLDFEGIDDVHAPWDIRNGPPFALPKHVYLSTRNLLRCVYLTDKLYKHAFDVIDKGISLPLKFLTV
ncbi:MAG: DUF362 domain-containing protein, partial [Thermofilaceae archaeon]